MNGLELMEQFPGDVKYQVYAVDQFGLTKSPVTGVRVENGEILLDIEVETD